MVKRLVILGLLVVVAFSAVVACAGRDEVSVSLSPAEVTLAPGASQLFDAIVSGTPESAVVWSATGGRIEAADAGILFTAPIAEGSFELTATSVADPSRSARAVVSVSAPAGSAVVRLRFSAIPGSDREDMIAASGLAEALIDVDSSETDFFVREVEVGSVGVIDAAREFGWTAVWPAWFSEEDAESVSALTAAGNDGAVIGSLSTAVWLVFVQPGIFHADPEEALNIVSVLRSLSGVEEFAGVLEEAALLGDPLDSPGFDTAYSLALEEAFQALGTLTLMPRQPPAAVSASRSCSV